ncbi:unnamed protein product [Medioppia subpectinata]|uniref:Uncharacterized protein n=1 Tax=Medioppia subpectinata TaxID=1979941 RepID=A0A7R9Q0A5_9ACAR|nr:unnamed protein product [Medioppia subpectinata]CAG2107853.1 unnamed protein product [Medioppia subpectinata]
MEVEIGFTLYSGRAGEQSLSYEHLSRCSKDDEALVVVQQFGKPLLLGFVIDYFSGANYMSYQHACMAAGGIVVCSALYITLHHPCLMRILQVGMRLRNACTTLMYQKCLKLSQSSLAKTTVGQIINIMSNDVNRFDEFAISMTCVIVGPIQAVLVIYITWTYLGNSTVVGLGLFVLYIPFQLIMGKLFSRCRLEVNDIRKVCYLKAINLSLFLIATKIILFCCFLTYVLLGHVLSSKSVFVTMALFNMLRITLTWIFPQGIAQGAELLVTCRRIQSSLLMTLLRELELLSGSIHMNGTVSYSAQEPWSFNNSVRNNILFGREYNERRYRDVVRVAALERDLKIFPFGDRTLVGEKGVSLSGRQKARITLARSLYRNADICLMDDPLSAVDAAVAEHIFEQCIVDYLGPKIQILVTHQIQFIRKATKILVLDDGKCLALGTFDELLAKGLDFMALIDGDDDDEDADAVVAESEGSSKQTSVIEAQEEEEEEEAPQIQDEQQTVGSIGGRTIFHASDLWLMQWTNNEETQSKEKNNFALIIYSVLIVALLLSTMVRSMTWFAICMIASKRLHNTIFIRLLRAPMAVFDNNPIGRILNRFTKDLGIIDEMLPSTSFDLNLTVSQAIGILVVVYNKPLFNNTECSAVCADNSRPRARNPVYSHVSTTLNGLASIRAYGAQQAFRNQFYTYQNDHSATWFVLLGASPLMLTGQTQFGVRQSAELESQMTSVERIIEYTKLPQEADLLSTQDNTPDPQWPQTGGIVLDHMSLIYDSAPDKPVLKDITCEIRGGEKIGIVGRTGAGKSAHRLNTIIDCDRVMFINISPQKKS